MSNTLELLKGKNWMNTFEDSSWKQFDRMINDFLAKRVTDSKVTFSPSCEVTEEDKRYLMKFDLPGVKKDQIKVEIDGDTLTVTAERREEKKEDTKKKHFSEVFYGNYTRSFTLPQGTDLKSVEAKYDNGILAVAVPKTQVDLPAKAKQIAVT